MCDFIMVKGKIVYMTVIVCINHSDIYGYDHFNITITVSLIFYFIIIMALANRWMDCWQRAHGWRSHGDLHGYHSVSYTRSLCWNAGTVVTDADERADLLPFKHFDVCSLRGNHITSHHINTKQTKRERLAQGDRVNEKKIWVITVSTKLAAIQFKYYYRSKIGWKLGVHGLLYVVCVKPHIVCSIKCECAYAFRQFLM